jgi:hypothetical protein
MNHADDEAAFRADLFQIASTTLSSKLLTAEKSLFGRGCCAGRVSLCAPVSRVPRCVSCVLRVKGGVRACVSL